MASSSQIKPGEIGSITVTVNVQQYIGKVTKEIAVYSNDLEKPRVNLLLKAEIRSN
jgi:hypothetical protein